MKEARRFSAAITLSLAVAVSAVPVAASPDAESTGELDAFFAAHPHAVFEWTEAEGVSDRAAILLPVTVDGREGWFQLDTGLDVTLAYGEVPDGWERESFDRRIRIPSFAIGAMRRGPAWVHARPDHDTDGDRLGSLGLDALIGKLTVLDYPRRRFLLMDPGEAPPWLWERASWTPAEVKDAKLFLTVTLGGRGMSGMFFDTGSSAFDITVDLDDWLEITGCAGPEEAATSWTVKKWKRKRTMLGAPARKPLVIGSVRIPDPNVYTLKEEPKMFEAWPFPVRGLIGNAPFLDRVVLIDLGVRQRFGVLQ
jgi:hypothetical protein